MTIAVANGRDRSELVIIRLYDPEAPCTLSARLRAVYEPWLGGASIDRGARMQEVTVEIDEVDE